MSKRRVRIATTGTYPDGMASAYRIFCYAQGLLAQGVPVEVVSTRSLVKYSGRSFNYKSVFNGVKCTILWNARPVRWRVIEYVWAEVSSFVLLGYSLATIRRYDVLWLYGMGVFPRLLLVPFLRLFGKRLVLELNEFPYSTEGSRLTRIGPIRWVLAEVTLRLVIPLANGVVVISQNLRDVVKRYAPTVPVLKVPILLAMSDEPSEASDQVRTSPHDYPYVFHAGSLSVQKDGIISVVRAYAKAAVEIREKGGRLDFVITNNRTFPEVWAEFREILVEHDLEHQLKVTGYLSDLDMKAYLRSALLFVVNKPDSFQNKFNFPTKVGDYLLSGRPVIVASKGVELNSYLIDRVNSRVVEPDDVDGMADAILEFWADSSAARRIGECGRRLAIEKFHFRVNAPGVERFLEMV